MSYAKLLKSMGYGKGMKLPKSRATPKRRSMGREMYQAGSEVATGAVEHVQKYRKMIGTRNEREVRRLKAGKTLTGDYTPPHRKASDSILGQFREKQRKER